MNQNVGVLIVAAVLMSSGFANGICYGEMYKWTDEMGNLHFTDDAGGIPEKYRKNKKELEQQNYRINNEIDAKRSKISGIKAQSVSNTNLLFTERDRLDREIPEKEKLCSIMRNHPFYSVGQYGDCLDELRRMRSERQEAQASIVEWEKIYNKAEEVEKTIDASDRPKRR